MAKFTDKNRYSDEYEEVRTSNRDKKRNKIDAQLRRSKKRGYDDDNYGYENVNSRLYRTK